MDDLSRSFRTRFSSSANLWNADSLTTFGSTMTLPTSQRAYHASTRARAHFRRFHPSPNLSCLIQNYQDRNCLCATLLAYKDEAVLCDS